MSLDDATIFNMRKEATDLAYEIGRKFEFSASGKSCLVEAILKLYLKGFTSYEVMDVVEDILQCGQL